MENNNTNNKKSIFKRIALLGSAALVTSAPMLALAPGAIAAITLGTVAGTAVIVKVVRNHKKAVNTKQSRKQAKLEVREEQKLNKKDLHKKMKSLKMEIKDHLGHTTLIEFNRAKMNIPLAESSFSFKPPSNVDIVDETQSKKR